MDKKLDPRTKHVDETMNARGQVPTVERDDSVPPEQVAADYKDSKDRIGAQRAPREVDSTVAPRKPDR